MEPSHGQPIALRLPRQTLACIGLAAVLCSQAVQLLITSDMEAVSRPLEPPSAPDHSRADWDAEEVTHLLQYLQAHKSEIADSGTFEAKTYTSLLPTLAPLRKSGAVKTVKHCSYKW